MNITYQDYLESVDKIEFIGKCLDDYVFGSYEMHQSQVAQSYYDGKNEHIMNLKPLRVNLKNSNNITLDFAKIPSNIFKRLVLQVCNYQLANGVAVNETPLDELLGNNANKKLLNGAISAMVHGVSYGFVNDGKLEKVYKATEMFTLDDEYTGKPMVAVHFWERQTLNGVKRFAQIFETDGITTIKSEKGKKFTIYEEKRPYTILIRKDGLGSEVVGYENPSVLPFIKLHVNENKESELTFNIKAKIDNLDEIVSRNATFVNRTSMIFWLINSTGYGDAESVGDMVMELEKLGVAVNESDGLSASPQVLNPNVEPRLQTKLSLEDDIYKDFMALNSESLTKGNLTATAINTSSSMLKMKANDLYYYICDFITQVCNMVGIEVESITMKEDTLNNDLEITQMVYLARADLTHKKTLELLPFIEGDEIEGILADFDMENMVEDVNEIDSQEEENEDDELDTL